MHARHAMNCATHQPSRLHREGGQLSHAALMVLLFERDRGRSELAQ